MSAVLLAASDAPKILRRISLEPARKAGMLAPETTVYDEDWVQELLYSQPGLVPLERIEAGTGEFLPLCRELTIPRDGGSVFLDVLGITRTGRLVLVECKLWRNPQARREVIAQITEYAALMRRWSFGDLTERLRQKLGWTGINPLYTHAARHWPDLDEGRFVDGVAASLRLGDFHLVVAGDGIRSDLQAIAAHLVGHGAGMARLALLEIQIWGDDEGRTLVVPNLTLKTEVIEQRVLMAAGLPVVIEDTPAGAGAAGETIERMIDPEEAAKRAGNRAFWQRFIDTVRFDHPEQTLPRHGGNNWVRLDLPGHPGAVTLYRSKTEDGLFLRLEGEAGEATWAALEAEIGELARESGLDLAGSVTGQDPFRGRISVTTDRAGFAGDAAELAWLQATANRFVSVMRPRLRALEGTEENV